MSKNKVIFIALCIIVAGSVAFVVSKKRQSQQSISNQIESSVQESQKTETGIQPTDTITNTKESPITTKIQEVSEITLTVSTPDSGSTTSSSKIQVTGKTSPNAEVFANEAEGIADANGNFSLSVALDEGENSIIVTAVDANGKVAEKEILVTYEINE